MSPVKVPYGKPVKLLVDLQGFPDGRLVQFEIWRKEGQKEEKIAGVNGVTKGAKGVAEWNPQLKRQPSLPLKDKIGQQTQKDQYYFIAKIDEQNVKSDFIEFVFPLEIFVEDLNGKPLNEVKFNITFSDGSKRTGVLRNGRAKFENAPADEFTIELEGYNFIFG